MDRGSGFLGLFERLPLGGGHLIGNHNDLLPVAVFQGEREFRDEWCVFKARTWPLIVRLLNSRSGIYRANHA